jgi:hypothetical protein
VIIVIFSKGKLPDITTIGLTRLIITTCIWWDGKAFASQNNWFNDRMAPSRVGCVVLLLTAFLTPLCCGIILD